MESEEVIRLSDLNLFEYTRESARWNAAGEIVEQDDLLLTRGAGRSPVTSVAMNLSYGRDGREVFDRIRSFYRDGGTGFSIHLRGHADPGLEAVCRQEQMLQIGDAPGMIADRPFPERAIPGIEIRPAADAAGVADLASVSARSYQDLGMPVPVCEKIFASPGRLLRPYNHLVVAYEADKPLSAAMILCSHGIAGIYWVGTVKEARGRGLAGACVAAVANEALRRGARSVVLQASKFGEPLYRKMGFRQFTRYPWYMKFPEK